jgi:hypothetical protein
MALGTLWETFNNSFLTEIEFSLTVMVATII